MKLIRPTPITDAVLVSSSVPETDYPAWATGTAYSKGQRVIRPGTHRCYESLVDGNQGHLPELSTGTSPPAWLDVGPTNCWAAFDPVVGTLTKSAGPLTLTLSPGRANALALLQVTGGTVRIQMNSASLGGPVYDQTVSLLSADVLVDWFAYFYEPVTRLTDVVFTDLPLISDGQITATISDPSVGVSLGTLVVGITAELGQAQYGARIGITDYSKKDTDQWGNTVVTQRAYSKKLSVDAVISSSQVDAVAALLASFRSTPAVWIGAGNKFQSMIIYGFYSDWEIQIAYRDYSICTYTIEGLV